jgi:hypothetical protein
MHMGVDDGHGLRSPGRQPRASRERAQTIAFAREDCSMRACSLLPWPDASWRGSPSAGRWPPLPKSFARKSSSSPCSSAAPTPATNRVSFNSGSSARSWTASSPSLPATAPCAPTPTVPCSGWSRAWATATPPPPSWPSAWTRASTSRRATGWSPASRASTRRMRRSARPCGPITPSRATSAMRSTPGKYPPTGQPAMSRSARRSPMRSPCNPPPSARIIATS